jgi:hypothetical protein
LQYEPKILQAAAVLYKRLVHLAQSNQYLDPEHGFLYDVQLLVRLTTTLQEPLVQVSEETMLSVESTAFELVCNSSFHPDVRQYSAQVLMQLSNHGRDAAPTLMHEFVSAFDANLSRAGHYSLQTQLVWLLAAFAKKHHECFVKFNELEIKHGRLEQDFSASLEMNDQTRLSPRKMLTSFNGLDPSAQVVSLKPLAQTIFGEERANDYDDLAGWFDFNLRSRDVQFDVRLHPHCIWPYLGHTPAPAPRPANLS